MCVHIHTPVDRHRRATLLQAVRAFCSCSELNMLSSQSNSACIATRRCTTATANFMDNGFYSLTQGSPLEKLPGSSLPCYPPTHTAGESNMLPTYNICRNGLSISSNHTVLCKDITRVTKTSEQTGALHGPGIWLDPFLLLLFCT